MNEFRINLIRGQVPDARQRRSRYWAMIAYLGLSGLALVLGIGYATSRLAEYASLKQRMRDMERRFADDSGATEGIRNHAISLEKRLERRVESLRLVNKSLDDSARLGVLVAAIARTLPAGVSFQGLAVSGGSRSVTLQLSVMTVGAANDPVPGDLIAAWQKEPGVASQISGISYLGSEVATLAGRNDMIWKFSAQLVGAES